MPLMPKRVKFRKFQRGRIRGVASRGNRVEFGEFGLQALQPGRISAEQIEAARVALIHYLRGEGKIIIRIFPHKSYSATPAETRMGKGKGEPAYWAAAVRAGTVLFELSGVPEDTAKDAFARVAHRMPIRTKMAHRRARI